MIGRGPRPERDFTPMRGEVWAKVPWPLALPCHEPCVYRLYGSDDQLIYVGMSEHPRTRLKQHARAYGDLVSYASVEYFATKAEAYAAESAAIHSENPRDNIAGLTRFDRVPLS